MVLLWAYSNRSRSSVCCGPQRWMQCSRWGPMGAWQRHRMPSLISCWPCCFGCSLGYNWLPGLWVLIVGSCPASHPPIPSPQTQQGCCQSLHPAGCIDKGGYPDRGAAPCTWPYGTSWGSHGSIPRACPGLSVRYPLLQVWSTTQLGDVCRLAEGALVLSAHMAPLPVVPLDHRHLSPTSIGTLSCWLWPSGCDHPPTTPHLPKNPPIKLISLQFTETDIVGDHVKSLKEIKTDDTL